MSGLVNMLDAVDLIQSNPQNFRYPCLMMQGSKDEVVSNAGANRWFAKAAGKKEKICFEDFCHELHKEPGKDQVFQRVLEYLS